MLVWQRVADWAWSSPLRWNVAQLWQFFISARLRTSISSFLTVKNIYAFSDPLNQLHPFWPLKTITAFLSLKRITLSDPFKMLKQWHLPNLLKQSQLFWLWKKLHPFWPVGTIKHFLTLWNQLQPFWPFETNRNLSDPLKPIATFLTLWNNYTHSDR